MRHRDDVAHVLEGTPPGHPTAPVFVVAGLAGPVGTMAVAGGARPQLLGALPHLPGIIDPGTRVVQGKHEARDQNPREPADEERNAPALPGAQQRAGDEAQRAADGRREVEEHEGQVALGDGVEVGDHGERHGREGGLADPDEGPEDQKFHEGPSEACQGRGQGPEGDADSEEPAPVHDAHVGNPAADQRCDHVDDDHARGRQRRLRVREVEVPLQEALHGARHVAVGEVQEVDARQHDQRSPCPLLPPIRVLRRQRLPQAKRPHDGLQGRPAASTSDIFGGIVQLVQ
mmetsp:Transcript_126508/g.393785  ORF Transcript_126508/g.393785 Transcript_126508/m.393785 type:complete len:288 (+) Transcript_126508:785-1648(+)